MSEVNENESQEIPLDDLGEVAGGTGPGMSAQPATGHSGGMHAGPARPTPPPSGGMNSTAARRA